MNKEKVKILIVDDSPTAVKLLSYVISSHLNLEVIGVAKDGEECLQFLKTHTPDLITIDVVMPGIQGFELTRKILNKQFIPVVIITGGYNPGDVKDCFKAIEAGALAILQKPRGLGDEDFHFQAQTIQEAIILAAHTKEDKFYPHHSQFSQSKDLSAFKQSFQAVAIGGSLGAPQVIREILSRLPLNFPVPIYIVQHILPEFTKGLAKWLDGHTPLEVQVAKEGVQGKMGKVYLAPDHHHLEVSKENIIRILPGDSEDQFCPSVSRLFRSMSASFGAHGVGIILSGMGRDGVINLEQMKLRGALTIAQDTESSLKRGMSHEAIRIGAARFALSPLKIAETLNKVFMVNSYV